MNGRLSKPAFPPQQPKLYRERCQDALLNIRIRASKKDQQWLRQEAAGNEGSEGIRKQHQMSQHGPTSESPLSSLSYASSEFMPTSIKSTADPKLPASPLGLDSGSQMSRDSVHATSPSAGVPSPLPPPICSPITSKHPLRESPTHFLPLTFRGWAAPAFDRELVRLSGWVGGEVGGRKGRRAGKRNLGLETPRTVWGWLKLLQQARQREGDERAGKGMNKVPRSGEREEQGRGEGRDKRARERKIQEAGSGEEGKGREKGWNGGLNSSIALQNQDGIVGKLKKKMPEEEKEEEGGGEREGRGGSHTGGRAWKRRLLDRLRKKKGVRRCENLQGEKASTRWGEEAGEHHGKENDMGDDLFCLLPCETFWASTTRDRIEAREKGRRGEGESKENSEDREDGIQKRGGIEGDLLTTFPPIASHAVHDVALVSHGSARVGIGTPCPTPPSESPPLPATTTGKRGRIESLNMLEGSEREPRLTGEKCAAVGKEGGKSTGEEEDEDREGGKEEEGGETETKVMPLPPLVIKDVLQIFPRQSPREEPTVAVDW